MLSSEYCQQLANIENKYQRIENEIFNEPVQFSRISHHDLRELFCTLHKILIISRTGQQKWKTKIYEHTIISVRLHNLFQHSSQGQNQQIIISV